MDEFNIVIKPVPASTEEEEVEAKLQTRVPYKIIDQEDGTYLVAYTLPKGGKYKVRTLWTYLSTYYIHTYSSIPVTGTPSSPPIPYIHTYVCIPSSLPIYQPTNQPTYLPTYQHTIGRHRLLGHLPRRGRADSGLALHLHGRRRGLRRPQAGCCGHE